MFSEKLYLQYQIHNASERRQELPIYQGKSNFAMNNVYLVTAAENSMINITVSLKPGHQRSQDDSRTQIKVLNQLELFKDKSVQSFKIRFDSRVLYS